MAQALWDADIDHMGPLPGFCASFYGAAGPDMLAYHTMMDQTIRASEAWKHLSADAYHPNNHIEITPVALASGEQLPTAAAAAVAGNPVLEQRVAHVRFAHAYLSYVITALE